MKKTIKMLLLMMLIVIIIILGGTIENFYDKEQNEIIPISSQKELEKIYNQEQGEESIFGKLLKLPFSLLTDYPVTYSKYYLDGEDISIQNYKGTTGTNASSLSADSATAENKKEYSTTNLQVENVDEADITKTDGNYIYSLSENNVIITDVRNEEQIKVAARISESDGDTIPEDLMLYQNKLIVIYEKMKSNFSYYHNKNTTYVVIYDISNPEKPQEIKNYEIQQPYYTSRCIEGKLYVIASGRLRKEEEQIITYYKEDGVQIDPGFSKISRIKDLDTDSQTILSMLDLNHTEQSVQISSYLMNIENAYVSENNIYLLDEKYKSSFSYEPEIIDIFGWKGLIGVFEEKEIEEETGYKTEIYKFNLLENGTIKFDKKTSEKGRTINQFSIDEYEDNLRLALYDNDGSRVVVFDKSMKKIGQTESLAEGEKMYSSRFLGNKAYLVTYKTVDPLFVIDLSTPEKPKVLGKLKIPGYSTYLHPYDENHIIGIGMQTEEKVNRNASGKVTSTTATITGMKMALFDVSDVNHPIQISDTIIGDRRTTSAILTNHKALLFSKEKELLAIPVNNYQEDFEVETSSDTYSSVINAYNNYKKDYISEGYFVYHLNVTDGFQLKGTITHNKTKSKYSYDRQSRLLRGIYIEDNLYTISEDYIKINKLEDLQEVNQLKIKED